MEKTNLELFKEALNEAWDNKIRREVESYAEEIVTSERHQATMRAILDGTYEKKSVWKSTRTKIAAILIAAALALASCAVAYRNEIKGFIIEIYEEYIKISFSEDKNEGKLLEEIYELTYLPEGYELVKQKTSATISWRKYCNDDNSFISFYQSSLSGVHLFNGEIGDYTVVSIGELEFFYNASKYHTYVWTDGKYCLTLECQHQISEEELMLIVEGIISEQR